MEKFVVGYPHNLSCHNCWSINQSYFVNISPEYYDNYYQKIIRINWTSEAANEQSKRIIEGLK
jgi:hypothetical protein